MAVETQDVICIRLVVERRHTSTHVSVIDISYSVVNGDAQCVLYTTVRGAL